MFGYIKPYMPEMKMSEFDTFKGIYCGLCKQLSHVYGPFSSLTLSYDFTFIATIALGLSDQCGGFTRCRCVANPLKKKMCHRPNDDLTFVAGCAMLMIYYKVLDDLDDSGFWGKIKAATVWPFAKFAQVRARKLYPQADSIIKEAITQQAIVEKSDSQSLDRAADPTAAALGKLCGMLTENTAQQEILYRFGYLVGRYVYFCDALDDLDKDREHGEYNPFLKRFGDENMSVDELKAYAVGLLNITVGEIAPAFELLELKRFKPILENIIYLGLHNSIKAIMDPDKSKKNEDN